MQDAENVATFNLVAPVTAGTGAGEDHSSEDPLTMWSQVALWASHSKMVGLRAEHSLSGAIQPLLLENLPNEPPTEDMKLECEVAGMGRVDVWLRVSSASTLLIFNSEDDRLRTQLAAAVPVVERRLSALWDVPVKAYVPHGSSDCVHKESAPRDPSGDSDAI